MQDTKKWHLEYNRCDTQQVHAAQICCIVTSSGLWDSDSMGKI